MATSRSLLAAVLVLVASAGFADAACNITAAATALQNINGAQTMVKTILSAVPTPVLTQMLNSTNGATILLPSDAAATALLNTLNISLTMFQRILASNAGAVFVNVLAYHVLQRQYRAADALGAGPYPVTLQTFASPTPSVPGFNTAVNLTVISGTTPTVQFISYTPANVTATDVFTVASCPTVSVHVINTVLLPLAPAIALAALPTIISALPPLPAPPPPPPKSAASSFSNVAILALLALVSAAAVSW